MSTIIDNPLPTLTKKEEALKIDVFFLLQFPTILLTRGSRGVENL